MAISKKQFYIITLLFLLLPFSINWRLIAFGKKTQGTVIAYIQDQQKRDYHRIGESYFCLVEFKVDGKTIDFITPENINYKIGESISILYNKKNPDKFVMFNAAGLILSNKMIIPGALLIVWLAFYLSVKQVNNNMNNNNKWHNNSHAKITK